MKDFILYKILRRKKPQEPEKFNILATIFMKNGDIHRLIGRFESSEALMNRILSIIKGNEHLTGLNANRKRVIIRTEEIDYVEIETEPYEE